MDGEFKTWVIREEESYKDAKSHLRHPARRLDEILCGVMWVLARKPDSFPKIPGLDLYVAKTDPFSDNPVFHIWFTFDPNIVSLLLIEEAQDPE